MKKFILTFFIVISSFSVGNTQAVTWFGSQILFEAPFSPSNDSYGRKWYEKDYDDNSWTEVKMPDDEWMCNQCDRYYRGYFTIDESEINRTNYYIKFLSNEGIWLYINGKYLGHWGGDTHQTGPVNKGYKAIKVEPVYINDYLIVGENVLSAHISDNKGDEYVEILITTRNKK